MRIRITEEQASQSAGVLYVLCDIDRIGILLNDIVNMIFWKNAINMQHMISALD